MYGSASYLDFPEHLPPMLIEANGQLSVGMPFRVLKVTEKT